MDKLTLLCAQELMEDLMGTASSSDEDEDTKQKMDVLTFLCAQNLMDTSSSSSSEEDDELLTILAYGHLLERGKSKDNDTVLTKSNKNRNNPKVINSHLRNGENHMIRNNINSTVLKESTYRSKEINFENSFPRLLAAKQEDNVLLKETEIPIDEGKENSLTNKENDPILPACKLQMPLDEGAIDSLSENEFKQYFHIERESLSYLMERFSLWHCKVSQNVQIVVKPNLKTALLTFLWFSANPVSLESVTQMFKKSPEDCKESLIIILDFFEKELVSELIKLPTSYIEKEAIAKDFEKIDGFPNVLGCLAVNCLPLKTAELQQRCGGPQLYLRGICDANQKFSSIKITFSKESKIDMFLEKGLPKLCFPKYHLLGDATCLIRDHLVIPYENSENLSKSEIFFNTKLSRTHVRIKEAFGNLVKRFRQLQYLDFNDTETLSKFIMACCVLHNMCIDRNDFYDAADNTDASFGQFDSTTLSDQTEDFLKDLGLMKRSELTQILFRMQK